MKLTDAKLRTLSEPGKHFDGAGLYLELTVAGGRYWRWKYRYGGKEKRLALGVYPEVGLKGAREAMAKARELLQAGQDPSEVRKADRAQVAHEAANTLRAVTLDWLTHQSDRWDASTKGRIKGTLEADIFPALGHRPMASIKPGEVMAAVQKIEKRGAADQAGRVFPSSGYRSKPLSENTLNSALARMGYKGSATAHGFRALFSTVANEKGWDADVVERQLAHKERNKIRAAYHRSTYLDDRARLMQWWADYLDGRKAGNVIALPVRAA